MHLSNSKICSIKNFPSFSLRKHTLQTSTPRDCHPHYTSGNLLPESADLRKNAIHENIPIRMLVLSLAADRKHSKQQLLASQSAWLHVSNGCGASYILTLTLPHAFEHKQTSTSKRAHTCEASSCPNVVHDTCTSLWISLLRGSRRIPSDASLAMVLHSWPLRKGRLCCSHNTATDT